MKWLRKYSIYLYLSVGVLSLSACSSSRKAVSSASVPHANKEKEIKEKYAAILGVTAKDIDNYPMYAFIDEWYGTPYKFGGRSREGVDCSDLVSLLYDKVYGTNLSGTCMDMFAICKPVKETDLKEGDLVFFRINSKHVSHVGVYLMNNKFVHASVHSGVVISDLTEAYYKKYFYKAGRPKVSLSQNTYKG